MCFSFAAFKEKFRMASRTATFLNPLLWYTDINILNVCPGFVRTQISYNALNAEGKPYNWSDPNITNGMTPERYGLETRPSDWSE
jgi:hypothetical protein